MMRLAVRSILPLALLVLAIPAGAQEVAPAVSPSSLFTGDYLLIVGSFVVVIVLLVAAGDVSASTVSAPRWVVICVLSLASASVSASVQSCYKSASSKFSSASALVMCAPFTFSTSLPSRQRRPQPQVFQMFGKSPQAKREQSSESLDGVQNVECCASTVGASDSWYGRGANDSPRHVVSNAKQ